MEAMQCDGHDPIGEKTLAVIAAADNFNKWMYNTIRPYVKGDILEIGSGIGNISQFFLQNKGNVTLTDLRSGYCEILKQKFSDYANLKAVLKLNLTHPEFKTEYASLLESYDTIVALNVVEHIENDELAIANCHKLLKPGGHVIIVVPAYQWLYNKFDKGLKHFRRYSRRRLTGLIRKNNFEIIHSQYFNLVAIAGWFVSGSILKKETIPKGQMDIFNKLTPVFKVIDKIIFNSAGISTICVGRRNNQ